MTLYLDNKKLDINSHKQSKERIYCEFKNIAFGLSKVSSGVLRWKEENPGKTPVLSIWIHEKKQPSWVRNRYFDNDAVSGESRSDKLNWREQDEAATPSCLSDDEKDDVETLEVKTIKVREKKKKEKPSKEERPIKVNNKELIGFGETTELVTFKPNLPEFEMTYSEVPINYEDLKRTDDLKSEIEKLKQLLESYKTICNPEKTFFKTDKPRIESLSEVIIEKDKIINQMTAEFKRTSEEWVKERSHLTKKLIQLTSEINEHLNEKESQKDLIQAKEKEILLLRLMIVSRKGTNPGKV